MPFAAQPVARLTAVVGERVDDAALGQALERAVDGREADSHAVLGEQSVDLLRGRVVAGGKGAEYRDALSGGPRPRSASTLLCRLARHRPREYHTWR